MKNYNEIVNNITIFLLVYLTGVTVDKVMLGNADIFYVLVYVDTRVNEFGSTCFLFRYLVQFLAVRIRTSNKF